MQGHRFEQRKKQRMNRILNVAIGVVVILILVFGAQIFFGSSSEDAAVDPEAESEVIEDTEQQAVPDPIQPNSSEEEVSEDRIDEDELANDELNEEEADEELEPVPDGEWEPIGTSQSGEFTPNFDSSSTNWAEMTQAIRYATGIEDMVIWRLENGGSPTRARGVVSERNTQDQRFEVYIEWVDGQGWMPVEKREL
ncbi:YrrS family protein [Halalkalibacter nanhaiisediminis]|uniref:Uncharacterized protein DUF1510 n=1 Tax=Halalkalibacter nanhaiisediminis TaxID=688079 RepID=A0A562QJF3_9BACI|nr:YrrS family protein [Halalkalibacter nanhaiisediminis]TWI56310.1 uncharacterized protein DUF1510 [Halalkalibacter nanhaiisediminis]